MKNLPYVVLITGASRGLGREVARLFARRGAGLIVTARGAEDLQATADELRALTPVIALPGDVADPVHADSLVRQGLAEFGRIGDAQRARAHALVEQGLVGKLRGLVPIFVPLTLNAIDRADTVGKVLEIRGFARRRFRPEFEPLGGGSWALLAVSLALLAVAVASILAGRDLIAATFALSRR